MKANREYRNMTVSVLESRDEEQQEERKLVAGYASTFNEPYILYENDEVVYMEVVDGRAFDETDMSDVIMQYDHQGRVFARISNNTLEVRPDGRGLYILADLGGTEIGSGLYEEIRGGYTDKMSIGFTVKADEVLRRTLEDGREEWTRTITAVEKLYDVSAVSIPANEGTSIGVYTRSKIDGAIEEVRAERLAAEELELERRRTELRARVLGREEK